MNAVPKKKPEAAKNVAKRRGPSLAERLNAWRELHLFSFVSSFGRIVQRPVSTLMTIGVIAVALALPLCFAVLLVNVEQLSGAFRESREISLFLKPGASAESVQKTRERVESDPRVESVVLRTPEEGMAEFRQLTDFAGALALLEENPLPAVLVVTPKPSESPLELARFFQEKAPDVDFVQHDAAWRARLSAWLEFGHGLALTIAALLGLGVLLVVGNTVRLDILSRAEEISTMQLLGATDGFVRRPFLYLGAWYGLFAGLLALSIARLARSALADPVAGLAESYGSHFSLQGLPWLWSIGALAASVALGWLGAYLAASHHLRHTLPERD
jgi:cell division transport system permease protein